MHIKDHSAAMKFFRTYDNVASKGKWKDFVDEMEFDSMLHEPRNTKLATNIPRHLWDNFNTPDLEQSPDSFLRPGETLEDWDVDFRRPNAHGGRIGFADGPPGITKAAQIRKEKVHLEKYGKVLSETEARSKGWEKRKTINLKDIRKNLVKNKKKVTMVNNQFIFANEKLEKEFIEDMILRYKYPKTSTAAKNAGVKSNAQIFETYFKGTYSEKGVHDLINRFKKTLGDDFSRLHPSERDAHKLRRQAKLLVSQAGKRISGLDDFPAHHLYPIGDEFAHGTQDFTILDKKTNSQLSGPNKKLVALAEQRTQLINDISSGKISVTEFDKASSKLDTKANFIIKKHYKKFPKHDGLLNWRKAGSMVDDQGKFMDIQSTGSIGGDSSKWAITDVNKQIKDLSKTELATFRSEVKKQALDLSTAEGRLANRQQGTAKILNKILEKNKIRICNDKLSNGKGVVCGTKFAERDPQGFLNAIKRNKDAAFIINKPGLVKGALRGLSGWIKKESGPFGWVGSIATIDAAFGLHALGQGATPLQALDETLWFLPKSWLKADEKTFKNVYKKAGFTDEDFGEFQKWMKLEDLDQQYFTSQNQLKFMEGQVLEGPKTKLEEGLQKEMDQYKDSPYAKMGWMNPGFAITSEEAKTGEHRHYGSSVDRHNRIITESQDVYKSLKDPEKSLKDLDYSRKLAAMERANRKKQMHLATLEGQLGYGESMEEILDRSGNLDLLYPEYVHPIEGPSVSQEQMMAAGFAEGGIASLKKKW